MKLNITTLFGLILLTGMIACGQAENAASEDGGSSIAAPASDDVKSNIEQRLEDYLAKTNEKDWNASFDYLYPVIFDIAPREEMIAAFEQMEENGFNVMVEDAEITDWEQLVSWKGTDYTQFTYNCAMQIMLAGEQFSDPMMMDMMTTQMQSQYGEDNVKFDSTSNTYDIDATRSAWAITGQDGNWYFVEETPQLDMVLDQIVPDTVQTLLGM
ncbi:MAG: hypothetical protein GYB31_18595 [Bacteroidetes bacterium]|nr:hypothetical protein [Bacteroidota bacterium]